MRRKKHLDLSPNALQNYYKKMDCANFFERKVFNNNAPIRAHQGGADAKKKLSTIINNSTLSEKCDMVLFTSNRFTQKNIFKKCS